MCVSQSSFATSGNDYLLTGLFQVSKQRITVNRQFVVDQSARWDYQNHIFAIPAPFFLSTPISAIFCPEKPFFLEFPETGNIRGCFNYHVTPVATITAVRTTKGGELFVSKTDGAIATIASFNFYFHLVNHRQNPSRS
jgi:hypothetical protein